MPAYTITPLDMLFFRDARPMEANVGSGGHGSHWPAPSVTFDALHAALWRAFPKTDSKWEHEHRFGRSSVRDFNRKATKRFGSLASAGPFPVLNGEWLFPCPADVPSLESDSETLELLKPLPNSEAARCNLPCHSWLRPLANFAMPSKETPPSWWARPAIQRYMKGRLPDSTTVFGNDHLFAGEWTTGIGMDPLRGKQDGERIYSAEYMRLREGVSLGIAATFPLKKRDGAEGMDELFPEPEKIVVGGQGRVCSISPLNDASIGTVLPMGLNGNEINSPRLKWVLLSPAIFPAISAEPQKRIREHPGGWLPNWVSDEDGRVLLRQGDTSRQDREHREQWRSRIRTECPEFSETTRLIAARIPKPLVVTGWSDRLQVGPEEKGRPGPKPTHLTVPPGAVYYFECSDLGEARSLADQLNWHGKGDGSKILNRRSTLMGEQGFGLGFCGTWEPHKE